MTGIWDPQRDFAYLKVPTSGVKSVVALSGCVHDSLVSLDRPFSPATRLDASPAPSRRTSPQVMVVTSEGVFYSYAIDLENGGECVLQKSYSLLDGIGDDSNGCVGASLPPSAVPRHVETAEACCARGGSSRSCPSARSSPMGD